MTHGLTSSHSVLFNEIWHFKIHHHNRHTLLLHTAQGWAFRDRTACSCCSERNVTKALESWILGTRKKRIWNDITTSLAKPDHSFTSHCGLARPWMNLPRKDGCRMYRLINTASPSPRQRYESAHLSNGAVWVSFGHARKTQWSSQTDRTDVCWDNKLWLCVTAQTNLKTNQEIQFHIFPSQSAPVCSCLCRYKLWITTTLRWNIFNIFALEIWVCGQLRCLENVSPTRFRHLILILLWAFLCRHFLFVFILIRICLSTNQFHFQQ